MSGATSRARSTSGLPAQARTWPRAQPNREAVHAIMTASGWHVPFLQRVGQVRSRAWPPARILTESLARRCLLPIRGVDPGAQGLAAQARDGMGHRSGGEL